MAHEQASGGAARDRRASAALPIVVGFDATPMGRDALELARVGARELGGRIEVVRVLEAESQWLGIEDEPELLEIEAEANRVAGDLLSGLDYEVKAVHGAPAAVLYDLAGDERAAAIVVGRSHRGSMGRTVYGSVAEALLQGAPAPVAVAPPDYARRHDNTLSTRIAVGYDAGEESRGAVHAGAAIAAATGATLQVIGVVRNLQPSPGRAPYPPLARSTAEEHLEQVASEVRSGVTVETTLLDGDAAGMLAGATEDADLLVVGSRGYGPIRRTLLGSVSRAVIHRAWSPVLVMPRSG